MRFGASDQVGGPVPSAAPNDNDAEILHFLESAPPSVRDWAAARAAEIRAAAGPAPAPARPAADDPADLALAELGEHDDEPRRRPLVHTPRDKEPTYVAPQRRSSPLVPLVGLLVVVALVYGIFQLGRPQETADPGMNTAAPANAADTTSRMAELEEMLAEAPDDVAVNLELGVLKFNAGDIPRAEELWTKVTDVDPRNPQAWFNLGFVHLAQDPPDVEGARADWEQVLEVAPESDLAATVESHLAALEAPSAAPSPSQTQE